MGPKRNLAVPAARPIMRDMTVMSRGQRRWY
jgi:hypothetical protein